MPATRLRARFSISLIGYHWLRSIDSKDSVPASLQNLTWITHAFEPSTLYPYNFSQTFFTFFTKPLSIYCSGFVLPQSLIIWTVMRWAKWIQSIWPCLLPPQSPFNSSDPFKPNETYALENWMNWSDDMLVYFVWYFSFNFWVNCDIPSSLYCALPFKSNLFCLWTRIWFLNTSIQWCWLLFFRVIYSFSHSWP